MGPPGVKGSEHLLGIPIPHSTCENAMMLWESRFDMTLEMKTIWRSKSVC